MEKEKTTPVQEESCCCCHKKKERDAKEYKDLTLSGVPLRKDNIFQ